MHYLPFLSTLVTFAFATAVFIRYLRRRGPHLLMWTIGLVFYGIGTLAEVVLAFAFHGCCHNYRICDTAQSWQNNPAPLEVRRSNQCIHGL